MPWEAAGFLRAHLAEQVTVQDVADHVGYSPAHLARAFAHEFGVGPGQYLAAQRFHAAKQRLLVGEDPVVDVCAAVGFTSLTTFTRRFRQAVGIAPARFRELADLVSTHEQTPFTLGGETSGAIRVHWEMPPIGLRRPCLVWVGWYPAPVPFGMPAAGRLVTGTDQMQLSLCPRAPWLLAFAVDPDAEPAAHVAPSDPLVARHPRPLTPSDDGAQVTLRFGVPREGEAPLLSALPALRPSARHRTD